MPYGSLSGGMGAAAGQTGAAPFSTLGPYLQMALAAYGALKGTSGTQAMADKFEDMGATNIPGQPASQSKARRTGRAVGQAALNFVPVAGPALSAVAGAYSSDVDAKARQSYLKRLLARNPEIVDPNEMGLRSEYVPQTNFAARYAESQPGVMQNMAQGVMKATTAVARDPSGMGRIVDTLGAGPAIRKLGRVVAGAQKDKADKEREIRKRNKDAALTYASKQRNKAVTRQAQQMGGQGQMNPEALDFLVRMLGPRFVQGAQRLGAGQPVPSPARAF